MPTLVAIMLVCLFFLLIITLLLFRKLNANQQTTLIQQELLLQLVEKANISYEINANNQQQLQQQLNLNHQHLAQQQSELKTYFEQQISNFKLTLLRQHGDQGEKQAQLLHRHSEQLKETLHEHHVSFNDNQVKSLEQLINQLTSMTKLGREEMAKSLQLASEQMTKRIDELTVSTDNRLKDISGQVEKRLADGFEKTTKTFNDILQRLALIDDAQKKITELSTNVVSLQEVLSDKRSRGAFGEVQLNALIRNVLPEQRFSIQHTPVSYTHLTLPTTPYV